MPEKSNKLFPTFEWIGSKVKKIILFITNKLEKMSDDVKVFAICAIILGLIVNIAIIIKNPDQKEKIAPLGTYAVLPSGVGNEITITLAGDIMCHDGQLLDAKGRAEDAALDELIKKAMAGGKTREEASAEAEAQLEQENVGYNFSTCFRDISLLIKKSDIAFANLEGTIVENDDEAYGYPYYFMPYEFAAELVDTGFNVFSLNNTQCFNARETGLHNTYNVLNSLGAFAYGAGESGSNPIVIESEGIKVGFVSAVDGGYLDNSENGAMARDMLSVYDRSKIRSDVEYCKDNGADFVIAYIRWGTENNNIPTDYMKTTARYLVSIGVDVVLGGGAHAVMPMEIIDTDDAYELGGVRKGYVFYSLGNFVSNQRTGSGDMGAVVELRVRKIADGVTRVVKYQTTPIYTNVDIANGQNFKVLDVLADSEPPDWMDETNKDRYIKVYSIVDTILNSLNSSECPYF